MCSAQTPGGELVAPPPRPALTSGLRLMFPGEVAQTLLFLHVLAAFAMASTVVIHTAFALGAAPQSRPVTLTADVLWAVGGLGTIVLGVILALDEGYSLLSGWIIGAIVLWMGATELGRRAQVGFAGRGGGASGSSSYAAKATTMHWLRAAAVVAILVLMVWKPGG